MAITTVTFNSEVCHQVTIEPIGTTIEVEEDQKMPLYAKAFGYPLPVVMVDM